MNSRTTRDFRKGFAKLPAEIQKLARKNYRLWVQDSSHPSLHFKKVSTNEPIFSVRVGLDYRAIGLLIGNTIPYNKTVRGDESHDVYIACQAYLGRG